MAKETAKRFVKGNKKNSLEFTQWNKKYLFTFDDKSTQEDVSGTIMPIEQFHAHCEQLFDKEIVSIEEVEQ